MVPADPVAQHLAIEDESVADIEQPLDQNLCNTLPICLGARAMHVQSDHTVRTAVRRARELELLAVRHAFLDGRDGLVVEQQAPPM